MRHLVTLLFVLALSSCQTIHKPKPVPSVAPIQNSLEAQKKSLEAAVGSTDRGVQKLKTAIELADELADIIEQLPETGATPKQKKK